MGQRQPPLAYLLYRLRGQRGEMNTHNLVNTKANYLKTFANMVNLSCEDCRILQLRFTKKTKLQKKKSQGRAQRHCGGQRKWFFLYVDVQYFPLQLMLS